MPQVPIVRAPVRTIPTTTRAVSVLFDHKFSCFLNNNNNHIYFL